MNKLILCSGILSYCIISKTTHDTTVTTPWGIAISPHYQVLVIILSSSKFMLMVHHDTCDNWAKYGYYIWASLYITRLHCHISMWCIHCIGTLYYVCTSHAHVYIRGWSCVVTSVIHDNVWASYINYRNYFIINPGGRYRNEAIWLIL